MPASLAGALAQGAASRRRRQRGRALASTALALAVMGGIAGLAVRVLQARAVEPPNPAQTLASLKTIAVPAPPAEILDQYVSNKAAAIQLGKALFWDMKVGSDNKTACATCHFHAGSDRRTTNQLSPGLLAGDRTFQLGGPNYTLKAPDFPLTKHVSVDQRYPQLSDINDVAGAQGVFSRDFTDTGKTGDACTDVSDAIFHGGTGFNINGINARQVTGRNAPTVINAAFNFRNFWDGRANNVFNGGDPFGMRNPNTLVWKNEGGVLRQIAVAIPTASLASQADGPPLSSVEMSCNGRTFAKLGRKLLGQAPLSDQTIAADDSVLGSMAALRNKNPQPTYATLIRQAFRPEYWNAPSPIGLSGTDAARIGSMDLPPARAPRRDFSRFDVNQMEANFALFFGLAVQLYESTLIANDTPFDRYLEGNTAAMNAQQIRGFQLFTGAARCVNCHSGPELTAASFRNVVNQRLEKMPMADGVEAVYDNGFYNIGVRPTTEDIGIGGTDPFGNPLSETRIAQLGKTQLLGNNFDSLKEPSVGPDQRIAVNGAFKTPGLRNIEFTGPYFHNGGKSTLMQVVDFYNRGGDFSDTNAADLDPDISPIGMTESQKQDLVAFLLALSDDRVRFRRAPFDHPSLCVPNGHQVTSSGALAKDGNSIRAVDNMQCLQAVGAGGSRTGLSTFLGLNPFLH